MSEGLKATRWNTENNMSSRTLRRLRNQQQSVAEPELTDSEVESETSATSYKRDSVAAYNPFAAFAGDSDSSEEETDEEQLESQAKNSFDVLSSNEMDDNNEYNDIQDRSSNVDKIKDKSEDAHSKQSTEHNNCKRKMKNKNKKKQEDDELDEIDLALKEIELSEARSKRTGKGKDIDMDSENNVVDDNKYTVISEDLIKLLKIDAKHLKEENELIRIFGPQIVQQEEKNTDYILPPNANGRLRRQQAILAAQLANNRSKAHVLSTKKLNWPPENRIMQLSMSRVYLSDIVYIKDKVEQIKNFRKFSKKSEEAKVSSIVDTTSLNHIPPYNSNDSIFYLQSSKNQKRIEMEFRAALNSQIPRVLFMFLGDYPYYVAGLLQASAIFVHEGELTNAADFINRVLYCYENNFDFGFDLMNGKCRLPYAFPDNRCFHLAIYKHIGFTERKGCWRTCLELSKLLFSLDPKIDPMGIAYIIDLYALRSCQFSWYLNFLKTLENHKFIASEDEYPESLDLSLIPHLPNHVWSKVLAQWELECNNDKSKTEDKSKRNKTKKIKQKNVDHTKSRQFLEHAIIRYPEYLVGICTNLGIMDDIITESSIFKKGQSLLEKALDKDSYGEFIHNESNIALQSLSTLYNDRCVSLWKVPEALAWLKENVISFLSSSKRVEQCYKECEIYNDNILRLYRNYLRHLVLTSDDKYLSVIPSKVLAETDSTLISDPIPPLYKDLLSVNNGSIDNDAESSYFWRALVTAGLEQDVGRWVSTLSEIYSDGNSDDEEGSTNNSWNLWGWGRGASQSNDNHDNNDHHDNNRRGFLSSVYNTIFGTTENDNDDNQDDENWNHELELAQDENGEYAIDDEYIGNNDADSNGDYNEQLLQEMIDNGDIDIDIGDVDIELERAIMESLNDTNRDEQVNQGELLDDFNWNNDDTNNEEDVYNWNINEDPGFGEPESIGRIYNRTNRRNQNRGTRGTNNGPTTLMRPEDYSDSDSD